jgi:hypothetical protein
VCWPLWINRREGRGQRVDWFRWQFSKRKSFCDWQHRFLFWVLLEPSMYATLISIGTRGRWVGKKFVPRLYGIRRICCGQHACVHRNIFGYQESNFIFFHVHEAADMFQKTRLIKASRSVTLCRCPTSQLSAPSSSKSWNALHAAVSEVMSANRNAISCCARSITRPLSAQRA